MPTLDARRQPQSVFRTVFSLDGLPLVCIQDEAAKLGVDVSACTVVDPMTSPELPRYIDLLVEARKHKVGAPPCLSRLSARDSRERSTSS